MSMLTPCTSSAVLGQVYNSPAKAASSISELGTFLLAAQDTNLAVIDPDNVSPGRIPLSIYQKTLIISEVLSDMKGGDERQ